eukprot:717658-Prymnesium_polylepis.1
MRLRVLPGIGELRRFLYSLLRYMWVPQVGSNMAQVWHGGKGPESPGLLPSLSGHGERIARTTPPPP